MTLQGRRKLCRPQPDLELIPPTVEDLLGLVGEPYRGDAVLALIARAKVLRVQGIEPLDDLVGPVLRFCVGPAVDVAPAGGRVGPYQQLEALQQPVVAILSPGGLVDVSR